MTVSYSETGTKGKVITSVTTADGEPAKLVVDMNFIQGERVFVEDSSRCPVDEEGTVGAACQSMLTD